MSKRKKHIGARVGHITKGLIDEAAELRYEGSIADLVRVAVLQELCDVFAAEDMDDAYTTARGQLELIRNEAGLLESVDFSGGGTGSPNGDDDEGEGSTFLGRSREEFGNLRE